MTSSVGSAHIHRRPSDAYSETSRSELSSALTDRVSCALRVAVRVRPIAPASGSSSLLCSEQQVTVGGADYCFDRVFDAGASQAGVYDELNVKQLVEAAFAGVSSSVLAYGQTGSGKTHTMLGVACSDEQPFGELQCAPDAGVIPRALVDLFEMAEQRIASGALQTVSVRLTCVEVYCDKLRDLLALNAFDEVSKPPQSPRLFSPPTTGRASLGGSRRMSMGVGREFTAPEIVLREGRDGMIAVEGANTFEIGSARDALRCVRSAAAARTTGSTAMNLQSSRSHAVFTLRVETTAPDGASAGIVRKSACELVFVDLAGSEGSKKSGAEGDRQREAIHINLGLHHLNNVIHELATQQRGGSRTSGVHVNYRNCKLTRLLQNSLGGTARTCIIACVSPRSVDVAETTDTLKYAERARQIRTRPIANVSATVVDPARQEGLIAELSALVKEREGELASARAALAEQLAEHEAALQQERDALADERAQLDADLRAQLDAQRAELEADRARAPQLAAEAHARELEAARASHAAELETARAVHAAELEAELEAARTMHAAQLEAARSVHAAELEAARSSHARALDDAHAKHEAALAAKDGTLRQQGLLELSRVLNLLGDVLDKPVDEPHGSRVDADEIRAAFSPSRSDSLASSALSFKASQLALEPEPASKPPLVVSVLGDKPLNNIQADPTMVSPKVSPCAVLVCSANPVNLATMTTTVYNESALAGDLLSP